MADEEKSALLGEGMQSTARLSRRNSVSLPCGLDVMEPPEYEPQLTPERVRHDGYDTSDTFSDGAASEDSEPETTSKLAVRTARKKSVVKPPAAEHSGESEDEVIDIHDNSPGNSITSVNSINSISSLLKEKLLMSFPRSIRHQKPKEYKLQGFVSLLFLTVVFLVGFAHVFYHQQVLQRAYFDRIRFNNKERLVRVFNFEGLEIALGYLATELPETDRVFRCLPQDERDDGSVCMEWMNLARLYLSYWETSGLRCYHFSWLSQDPAVRPTDCYEDGDNYGHWYGGGRSLGMAWPVELGRVEMSAFVTGQVGRHRWGGVLRRYFINSRGVAISVDTDTPLYGGGRSLGMAWPVELGRVEMSAFVTGQVGRHRWGGVLRRYFINSRGVAISVDTDTPLYVSINADKSTRLCLQGRHDDFAYMSSQGLPKLNYSVCTATNMKLLHSSLSEKSLWDGLREEDISVINSLLTEPVWQIAPQDKHKLTEQAVINYTEDVIALGFLRQGHVLLNEFWQAEVGDFTVDTLRFPTMEKTIEIIHRRGFRIALTVQPFIGTESANFAGAVSSGLLVLERGLDRARRIPALTSYKSVASAGMLDITNNNSIPWLQRQLQQLVTDYQIDSFYLDIGTAYDMPLHYSLHRNLTNPDEYKALFTSAVLGSVSVITVSGAISRPPAPIFVSLPSLPSTWESLQVIIPTTLTFGIIGYPFLMPGPVGGDFVVKDPLRYSSSSNSSLDFDFTFEELMDKGLPNKELYIRWLQLATFLPVIRYSHLPSEYRGDDQVLELAKVLTALRQKMVNPLLKKYAQEALDSGTPLIRPLWMLDPGDSACHLVKDEFSVGEELIVAPILRPNTHEREVYLPAGVWKDGIDGSLRKGSRWIHSYKVPLEKIAYFLKMPDNTRF